MRFQRITVNPQQMGAVPCVRGDNMSDEEILKAFPDLDPEDIREALRYAAEAVRERELPLVTAL